jgi:hypothetical protein
MTPFLHVAVNVCVDKLRLKINLSKGAKISEQPFTTELGIPSSPTDFVDHSYIIALLTSSLTEAIANVLLYENRSCKTLEGALLCTD